MKEIIVQFNDFEMYVTELSWQNENPKHFHVSKHINKMLSNFSTHKSKNFSIPGLYRSSPPERFLGKDILKVCTSL